MRYNKDMENIQQILESELKAHRWSIRYFANRIGEPYWKVYGVLRRTQKRPNYDLANRMLAEFDLNVSVEIKRHEP